MKRFLFFLLPVILIFAFSSSVFALADVPNKTVSVMEGKAEVVFYGTATFAVGDSTSSLFTQAMTGDGWLDWDNAQVTLWSGAVSGVDVNCFLRGGPIRDLTYITSAYTQTVWDDVNSATPIIWWAFKDTLRAGVLGGFQIKYFIDPNADARFKVFEFDGQAANRIGNVVTWYIVVPKKPGAPRTGVGAVFDTT